MRRSLRRPRRWRYPCRAPAPCIGGDTLLANIETLQRADGEIGIRIFRRGVGYDIKLIATL
jgi:hypothetical protein